MTTRTFINQYLMPFPPDSLESWLLRRISNRIGQPIESQLWDISLYGCIRGVVLPDCEVDYQRFYSVYKTQINQSVDRYLKEQGIILDDYAKERRDDITKESLFTDVLCWIAIEYTAHTVLSDLLKVEG